MIEAATAAATALSIARWNQHQRQEQEQRLRQLMVEMNGAIEDGGGDPNGRRPTLRRSSSSVDSHGSRTSDRGSISGGGSISGSGMWNTLEIHTHAHSFSHNQPAPRWRIDSLCAYRLSPPPRRAQNAIPDMCIPAVRRRDKITCPCTTRSTILFPRKLGKPWKLHACKVCGARPAQNTTN